MLNPPDLDLVGMFHGPDEIVSRLQPVPCVGTATESLIKADRHFRRYRGKSSLREPVACGSFLKKPLGPGLSIL